MRAPTRLLVLAFVLAACASPPPDEERDAGAAHPPAACTPCVSSVDCAGAACVQLANDSVCAGACRSDADCAPSERCTALATAEGVALSACLPRDGACGPIGNEEADGGGSVVGPAPDAGTGTGAGAGGWCGQLAGPDVGGTSCACHSSSGGCAPNNCFGGWFCDTSTGHCVQPPPSCEQPDAGSPSDPRPDGGTPPRGKIDPHLGGTSGQLRFAVVGDTRPGRIDDTSAYPVTIVQGIYDAIKALQPAVDFVVTTGDYMFATPGHGQDAAQMSLYLQARGVLSQPLWAALGNHECTGATASNCGPEAGRTTTNYETFIDSMMRPIGESLAYYARRVDDVQGRWTAKIVVVAPNAWGPVESAWLERELSVPTTYTFVVHHEPAAATTAPGMPEINRIVARHPVTISIVGHTHTWSHGHGEVVVGNGGAPLTSTVPYGYTLVAQRSDGAIVVTAYDSQSGRAFQTFAVHADGSSAP